MLPLEANVKLNQGKFISKLTQNQHKDCIQAVYHTNSSTAINNNEVTLAKPHLLTTE